MLDPVCCAASQTAEATEPGTENAESQGASDSIQKHADSQSSGTAAHAYTRGEFH